MVTIDTLGKSQSPERQSQQQQHTQQQQHQEQDSSPSSSPSSSSSTTISSSLSPPTLRLQGESTASENQRQTGFSVQVREATPALEDRDEDEEDQKDGNRKRKLRAMGQSLEDPGPSTTSFLRYPSGSAASSRVSRERRHSNILNPYLASSHLRDDASGTPPSRHTPPRVGEDDEAKENEDDPTTKMKRRSMSTSTPLSIFPQSKATADQLLLVPPTSLLPPDPPPGEVVNQSGRHHHHHHHGRHHHHHHKPPVSGGIRLREHRHHSSHHHPRQTYATSVSASEATAPSEAVTSPKRGSSVTRCSHLIAEQASSGVSTEDGGDSKSTHVVQRTQSNPEMEYCPVCLARKECEILLKRTYSKVNEQSSFKCSMHRKVSANLNNFHLFIFLQRGATRENRRKNSDPDLRRVPR